MLNKSFGVIYFHFGIFSEKKQKTGVKICIFGFLENVSQVGPFHTIFFSLVDLFWIHKFAHLSKYLKIL